MKTDKTASPWLVIAITAFLLCFVVTALVLYGFFSLFAIFFGGQRGLELVNNRVPDLTITLGLIIAGVLIFVIYNKFRK